MKPATIILSLFFLVTACSRQAPVGAAADMEPLIREYLVLELSMAQHDLGKDLVRDFVERGNADTEERWRRFESLLCSPMTAGDLR